MKPIIHVVINKHEMSKYVSILIDYFLIITNKIIVLNRKSWLTRPNI